MHAECSEYVYKRRIKPRNTKIDNHSLIFTKITRYFSPVLDISTFKRPFHSILHAEHSAYVLYRRKAPRGTQIAIIRRFCRKLCVISLPFKIFRRLNANFTPFCMQNVVHTFASVKTNPETRKSLSFVDFDDNCALFHSPLKYFDV